MPEIVYVLTNQAGLWSAIQLLREKGIGIKQIANEVGDGVWTVDSVF